MVAFSTRRYMAHKQGAGILHDEGSQAEDMIRLGRSMHHTPDIPVPAKEKEQVEVV